MTETTAYKTARRWKIRSCQTGDSFTSHHQFVPSFRLSDAAEEGDDKECIRNKPPVLISYESNVVGFVDGFSFDQTKRESIESLLLSPSPSFLPSLFSFFLFFCFFIKKVFYKCSRNKIENDRDGEIQRMTWKQ